MLSINPINPNDNFYNETLAKLNGVSKGKAKLKAAAEAFESILVYQMFKSMNKNIIKSDLIEENQGEKVFQDFLLKTRSENLAKNSNLGIAELIYQQLSTHLGEDNTISSTPKLNNPKASVYNPTPAQFSFSFPNNSPANRLDSLT